MSSKDESSHGDAAATSAHRELPDEKTLAEAGEIMIKDKDGKDVPLKSLWSSNDQNDKHLVIFIRHFFCGVRPTHLALSLNRTKQARTQHANTEASPAATPPPELQTIRPSPSRRPPPAQPRHSPHKHLHHRLRRADLHPKVRRGHGVPVPNLRGPQQAHVRRAGDDIHHARGRRQARVHQDQLCCQRDAVRAGRAHVGACAVGRAAGAEWWGVVVRGRGAEVVPSHAEHDGSY